MIGSLAVGLGKKTLTFVHALSLARLHSDQCQCPTVWGLLVQAHREAADLHQRLSVAQTKLRSQECRVAAGPKMLQCESNLQQVHFSADRALLPGAGCECRADTTTRRVHLLQVVIA
jgi:hypothetical protein